jgi:hypothetical protein
LHLALQKQIHDHYFYKTSFSAYLLCSIFSDQQPYIAITMPSRSNRNIASGSLRKLKTVFSTSHTHIPNAPLSPVSENSDSCWTVSRSSTGSRFSQLVSSVSSYSIGNFSIRRSPSQLELEQEEEKIETPEELLSLIEPRPFAGTAVGGFEDVLFGRL